MMDIVESLSIVNKGLEGRKPELGPFLLYAFKQVPLL